MVTIQLLEDDDILEPTDFYRFTRIWYMGQSDTVETTSMYGGGVMNFFLWMRLNREYGSKGWYGKTVRAVRGFNKSTPHQPGATFEFARGPIPVKNQMPETNVDKRLTLGNTELTFGKYKGTTIADLNDDSYLRWLFENVEPFKNAPLEIRQKFTY